jgi:hypothetical protein
MQLPYATASYSVYVPDTGVRLDTGALSASGSTQMGGQSYALYSATNVARSTMIGAQLSGLGASSAVGPSQLAIISLGVVLFVLGGGVLLFGSRLRPGTAVQHTNTEQERLELIVRLAALDERFAAGEVSKGAYRVERERGKRRLRELTVARREPSPTAV